MLDIIMHKRPSLELEHNSLPCSTANSSTIAEAGGVGVRLDHVNVLKPTSLHRYYLGMAFTKIVVGAVEHYGRRPSDPILCPSDQVRKCRDDFWQ
jgi:hypothetical protein